MRARIERRRPGTAGEGQWDGLLRGILGILLGAGLYAAVSPVIMDNFLRIRAYGKLTLPTLLGVHHWAVIAPLVFILGGFLLWIDRRGW